MTRDDEPFAGRSDYLRRLEAGHYRGEAYVHWTMTIDDRRTGWLTLAFHAAFREVLVHAAFRYGICSPIYCCMPDHFHLLLIGLHEKSDQAKAIRFVRKHVNCLLEPHEARLQQQPYDHVLREEERERTAFENVVEYIARNPERKKLVRIDGFKEYSYSGCLAPGYPELKLWENDYWSRFWRIHSFLRREGLAR